MSTMPATVGRQPILDRALNVQAYELLFRPAEPISGEFDGNKATAQVILNTLGEIGLQTVVGNYPAYINFTAALLADDTALLLPRDHVVLEILEDTLVDADFVQTIESLVARGYSIALDDFVYNSQWDPLIALTSVIKIDVLTMARAEVEYHLRRFQSSTCQMVAEKVETQEDFEVFHDMGFDLFQGYFFCKPKTITSSQLPANHLALLKLLAKLQDPDADIGDIERTIGENVALSYKLLRWFNSAFFSLPQKVDSIRRAVVYFGVSFLKQWVTLMAMADIPGKPHALMQTALVRAKACERFAAAAGQRDLEPCFTVGLFSVLDALLDRPMAEILQLLPLSEDIAAALTDGEGHLGKTLSSVIDYEQCRWSQIKNSELPPQMLAQAYAEALNWAQEATPDLSD